MLIHWLNPRTQTEKLAIAFLFRQFSKLRKNRDAICNFAAHYGSLFSPGEGMRFETLHHWYEKIDEMNSAVAYLDAIECATRDAYNNVLVNDHAFYEYYSSHKNFYSDKETENVMLTRLFTYINRGLNFDYCIWLNQDGIPRLRMEPKNLIAALWLQLALYVTEQKRGRQCEMCGKWFEIGQDAKQKNSKYCSNACRCAAYRRNKNNLTTHVK